jgi:hypothetical protein
MNVESEGTIFISVDSISEISLSSDSKITFNIFGYDSNIADASATLLQTYVFSISTIPCIFELDYSVSWNENIEPTTGAGSDFKYYLTIGTNDRDNDELVTDYEHTNDGNGPLFVNHLSELSQSIYIKNNE